jgi:hypothetical protein
MIDSRKQLVIDAIQLFDQKANELISLLADEFDLDLIQANPFSKLLSRQNDLWKGNLKNNWSYKFHGDSCEFVNTVTHQFLDVKINRKGNFGVIDNFYLFRFIETTESLKNVLESFRSKENLYNILDELERDKIIIDIDEFPFRSRFLNYEMIKMK